MTKLFTSASKCIFLKNAFQKSALEKSYFF